MAITQPLGSDDLAQAIFHKLTLGLRDGPTVRSKTLGHEHASFAMHMDQESYDFNTLAPVDASFLHRDMKGYMKAFAKNARSLTHEEGKIVQKHLSETLARMVYTSNAIDGAGGGLSLTTVLCQDVFHPCKAAAMTLDTTKYNAVEADRRTKGLPCDVASVFRTYREIVQHAEAARYIIEEVYLHGNDLSEEVIMETHRILTHGIDEGRVSWKSHSGVYRHGDADADAGLYPYSAPGQVRTAMGRMIYSLRADLRNATRRGEIDGVALSAKYCHILVNIHPFLSGNGRVGRLILNVLLLKYGGMLVSMGDEEDDRDNYLTIAAKASYLEDLHQDDIDGMDESLRPRFYDQLAAYTLDHARDSIGELVHPLKNNEEAAKNVNSSRGDED